MATGMRQSVPLRGRFVDLGHFRRRLDPFTLDPPQLPALRAAESRAALSDRRLHSFLHKRGNGFESTQPYVGRRPAKLIAMLRRNCS